MNRTHREELSVDKERGGDSQGQKPENDDSAGGSALDEVSLHGEHDAEEPVAGDEGQRHDAGHEGEHCNQNDRNAIRVQLLAVLSLARGFPCLKYNCTGETVRRWGRMVTVTHCMSTLIQWRSPVFKAHGRISPTLTIRFT